MMTDPKVSVSRTGGPQDNFLYWFLRLEWNFEREVGRACWRSRWCGELILLISDAGEHCRVRYRDWCCVCERWGMLDNAAGAGGGEVCLSHAVWRGPSADLKAPPWVVQWGSYLQESYHAHNVAPDEIFWPADVRTCCKIGVVSFAAGIDGRPQVWEATNNNVPWVYWWLLEIAVWSASVSAAHKQVHEVAGSRTVGECNYCTSGYGTLWKNYYSTTKTCNIKRF